MIAFKLFSLHFYHVNLFYGLMLALLDLYWTCYKLPFAEFQFDTAINNRDTCVYHVVFGVVFNITTQVSA